MKEKLRQHLEEIYYHRKAISIVTTTLLIFTVAGFTMGYQLQSEKIPDKQVVEKAAEDSFNHSMQQIEQDNWDQARKHIDAGTSFLSVLHQTGETKWQQYWFSVQLSCIQQERTDKCQEMVNLTLEELGRSNSSTG